MKLSFVSLIVILRTSKHFVSPVFRQMAGTFCILVSQLTQSSVNNIFGIPFLEGFFAKSLATYFLQTTNLASFCHSPYCA